MSTQQLPPWENDSLSEFFKLTEYNIRVTILNHPEIFELIKRINSIFKTVLEAIEHDSKQELVVPRFLIVRTFSSFLAAIRLAMSGQFIEAFPVLRQAIEQAWYALHIAKDPSAHSRGEIWLRRNEDARTKAKCQQEFTIANVRATHEALDIREAGQFKELYERVIDYGAHPNQLGILIGAAQSKGEKKIDYKVGIIYPKTLPMMITIRFAIAVAIGSLKVFQRIFPERFKIMSIDKEIEELIVGLNSVFKQYLRK